MDTVTSSETPNSRLALLRELVLESSLEVLDRDGLGLSTDVISYARVFASLEQEHDIRVTGGSIQGRVWASHNEFRDEVLAAAASHSSPYQDGPGMHEAIVHVLRTVDELGLDHQGRVRAFCRIAGQALLTGYLESDQFRRFQAIKGAARGGGDEAATTLLRSMVSEQADGNQDERVQTFGFIFKALGLRASQELGLSDDQAIGVYMTLVQMLVTGAHLDHHAGFTKMASEVDTGLQADDDWPWTYFGFGFLAGIELLFEQDPDAPCERYDYQAALDALVLPSPANRSPGLRELVADRPRRSRKELRNILVACGVELLLRDGISLKANSLTYAAVFAHIQKTRGITVHRSSVHKHLWSSQDDFRADVLAEAARYHTEESLNMAKRAMAAQTVSRNPDGSPNLRQMILDSTLAIVSAQMHVSARSSNFRRWQSIKASTLSAAPEEHLTDLRKAVSERYDELIADFVETYRSVLPLVGLKVNPDLKMSEDQAYLVFAIAGAAFTNGADYNISAGATLASHTIPLPRADQSGETADWPIQAIASLAMLDLLFVPE